MRGRNRPTVFVLWARGFDEAAAAIFVTELRTLGVRVQLVSLDRRRAAGLRGLVLEPDLTLEAALPLATEASAVVIPCAERAIRALLYDPRLTDFLDRAQEGGARIYAGRPATVLASTVAEMWPLVETTLYPQVGTLVQYARGIGQELSRTG